MVSEPACAPPLVLVVDDAEDQLRVLTGILADLDCRLATARCGEETLETVRRDRPDLILLDVVMPGMDGLEVLRELKERPETSDLPVIILTAKGEVEDIVAGLEAGAADYIAKPFSAAELKARVKTHLNFKRMRDHHKGLIAELQTALAEVKQLSGMIPICAHCKKVRNDLGYWQQVEEYLGGQTEALFTHGLCPDCVALFFPEFHELHPAAAPAAPPPLPDGEELPRILIVDDSPMSMKMLIQFLRLDYKILVATSGPAAIELAQREHPDLVLLDVQMPEMDGREVCRLLKADPRTRSVPVIFVTGNTEEIDEIEGFELGAVDYITKPFSLPLVHARVRTHLELKRFRDILALQVMRDELTGLHNRKGLLEFLALTWKQAIRTRLPVSIALFDVDQLKAFNQYYGRKAGDDCIRRVASALKAGKRRDTDLLARYGGQEFVCLLPGTEPEGAARVAEFMKARVDELRIPHAASRFGERLTLSVGVAGFKPVVGSDPAALLELASQALHRARQGGRDRVSV